MEMASQHAILGASPSLSFSIDPDLTSVNSPLIKLPPLLSVPAVSCCYSDTYSCSDVKIPTKFHSIMLWLKVGMRKSFKLEVLL